MEEISLPGFTQVAPGVLVAGGMSVSIAHPDPCWFIRNEDDTAWLGEGRSLYVFDSEEKASAYIAATNVKGAVVAGPVSWDELVDRHGGTYSGVAIDPPVGPGFCGTAPLRKGI